MKLASVVSDKKGFLKYVNSKRRPKENIRPIFVEDGHLRNKAEEEEEAFSASFASVFNNTGRPWGAQSSESEDHEYRNNGFPFVYTGIARDQLHQLNVQKSMKPGRIHCRVLKELADITAGPLSITYQSSWESQEVPADWKLANVTPI